MGTKVLDDLTNEEIDAGDASTIVVGISILLEPTGERFESRRQFTIKRNGVRNLVDHPVYQRIRTRVARIAQKLDRAITDFDNEMGEEKNG